MWQKAAVDFIGVLSVSTRDKESVRLSYWICEAVCTAGARYKNLAHDFEIIVEKIRNGKAHELSEGDTLYLGAAPKAATSRDRRKQPFSAELAKPRAFAFKNSYMTYVLNNYIIPGKNTYEPIIKGTAEESFEDCDCEQNRAILRLVGY